MARSSIRFLRRGAVVECSAVSPDQTVLDYLRLVARARGTKEGCNEGDCGACTVAIGTLRDERLIYEPANACIMLLGHLDGKELVTVDDLDAGGTLHPVQEAMVREHASQCGFCTPGFVMSLFTLYHEGRAVTRQEIVDRIAGNLCRCTGYRPIIDAAAASCGGAPADLWSVRCAETQRMLAELDDGEDVFVPASGGFLAIPAREATILELLAAHPDATVVAGATDVGLWINKQMRHLPKIVMTRRVKELREVRSDGTRLTIGGAATYAEVGEALASVDPDIGEALRRLGSAQVRSAGTVGGNIANGSPIGDTPPILIALGAEVVLRNAARSRKLPLEDFFIAYGRQDRGRDELLWSIEVPHLRAGEHFRCYKISKRFDQDISAVMGAFKITCDGRQVLNVRIAFGGMAATPKRAPAAERAAAGLSLDAPGTWEPAISALEQDFTPISDMRASAGYRMDVARALLRKALAEIAAPGTSLRVVGARGEAA